jgi:hypothetical protein
MISCYCPAAAKDRAMRPPPNNETEYWDRVIELAATANETTTAEDVRAIMGLSDEVMALIDREAFESFQKRQPNPNRPIEDMIDAVSAWESKSIAKVYQEEGLKELRPGETRITQPLNLVPTERSHALQEAKRAFIRATTRDRRGDLTAMERVYRLYRAMYKALFIALKKEYGHV